MGYDRDQILSLYNMKMDTYYNQERRDREEEDINAYNEQLTRQENMSKASLALEALKAVKTISDNKLATFLDQTYESNVEGIIPKKYKLKEPRSFKQVLKDIGTGKNIERMTARGKIEETEGYKEFAAERAAKDLKKLRGEIPLADEEAVDEEILGDTYTPKAEAPVGTPDVLPVEDEFEMPDEDMIETPDDLELPPARLSDPDPDYGKSLYDEWRSDASRDLAMDYAPGDDWAGEAEGLPDYETWKKGVETGEISTTYTPKAEAPDVPIAEDEVEMPDEDIIETPDDLETPDDVEAPPARPSDPDYGKIEKAAEDTIPLEEKFEAAKSDLQRNRIASQIRERNAAKGRYYDLETESVKIKGKSGTRISDRGDYLDDDFDITGTPEDMPEIMAKSPQLRGAEDAPLTTPSVEPDIVPDAKPDVEIPDAKGVMGKGADIVGKVGKGVGAVQTGVGLVGDIKTLTGEGTDEEKILSGAKTAKTAADLASKALVKKGGEEALKKGAGKALGVAAKGLGAGVGVYTGLKTALDEEATDVQRVGGGMTAAGSAMLGASALNIWNPAGWIGGAVGTGLTIGGSLMSMFGGKKKKAAAPSRRRIDTSRYYKRRGRY